jgi:hypothetical protein
LGGRGVVGGCLLLGEGEGEEVGGCRWVLGLEEGEGEVGVEGRRRMGEAVREGHLRKAAAGGEGAPVARWMWGGVVQEARSIPVTAAGPVAAEPGF